jgi:hypothetical protein
MFDNAKSLVVTLLLLVIPSLVFGFDLRLGWDANSVDQNVSGYKLYLAYSSGNYYSSIDVGNSTEVIVTDLDASRRNIFAVTAYRNCQDGDKCNSDDCAQGNICESDKSEELSVNPQPTKPSGGNVFYAKIGNIPVEENLLSNTNTTFSAGNNWNLYGSDLSIENGELISSGEKSNQAASVFVSNLINGKIYTIEYEVVSYVKGSLWLSQWGFPGRYNSIELVTSVGVHRKDVTCIDSTKTYLLVFNEWKGSLDNVKLFLK